MRPPTLFPNACRLAENPVHGPLQRLNTRLCIDLLQQFSNKVGMRLNEAKKSVRVLPIAAAADPQAKVLVDYRNYPAPILRCRFFRLKPFVSEIVPEEFRQPFSPQPGVDLLLLAIICGESIGAKHNMRLHGNPIQCICAT